MYIRVYNNELIRVYMGEDLYSSEVIGKIKGKNSAGVTIQDKNHNMVFYDIATIASKELQLIIRNSDVATIAIKLTDEEIVEYFYSVAKKELLEQKRESYTEEELLEWMNKDIDSCIMNSSIWNDELKEKVMKMLAVNNFRVQREDIDNQD